MVSKALKIGLSVLAACVPAAAVFGANGIWPSGEADGVCVTFRPPTWSYIVFWSLIVTSITIGWLLLIWQSTSISPLIVSSVLFLLIFTCTTVWQWRYHQPGKKADGITIFLFLICFVLAAIVYTATVNIYTAILIVPLLVWGIYQLVVNAAEVSCDPQTKTNT